MKKILITGGTGFIGSHIARHLSKKSEIYILSRTKPIENIIQNVEYIQSDFSEHLQIEKLPSNLDCIIHLAGTMDKTASNNYIFQINTTTMLNLLEYGKKIGIERFIFASTGGVYGYNEKPLSEDLQCNPIDFYCLSKYQSEILAKYYSQYFSVVILRYFFPYGNGQTRGIFPTLVDRIKNGKPIILYNDGNPFINPIHISDVVELMERTIYLDNRYTIINIAGEEIINIRQLSDLIGEFYKISPVYENIIDSNITNLIGDTSKMKSCLRYSSVKSVTEMLSNHDRIS